MKCRRCPLFAVVGKSLCEACRFAHDTYCTQRARDKKMRGECYNCPNLAIIGKSRCGDCSIKHSRRNVRTRKNSHTGILSSALRTRLRMAVRRGQKAGSAVRDLGCSIEELRKRLEVQFRPGMTWENWSRTGWHIDHIRPLASFDLTDRTQLLQACHYTNLQPLWAEENLKKGDQSCLSL